MFVGINICVFETKNILAGINIYGLGQVLLIIQVHELCLQVFIFAI